MAMLLRIPIHRLQSQADLLVKVILAMTSLCFVSLVARQALAAPIRAYGGPIWYIPDALMAGSVVMILVYAILTQSTRIVHSFVLIALWCIISLAVLNPLSVGYGTRFVANLVVAIFVGAYCRKHHELIFLALTGVSALATFGVFLDNYFSVPWDGMTFEGAMGTNEINRQWWLDDQTRRIGGFGIASTDTALTIAITFLFASRVGSRLRNICTILAAPVVIFAVWLTQQRATIFWFVLVWTLSFVVPLFLGRMRVLAIRFLQAIIVFALMSAMFVPFLLQNVDVGAFFGVNAFSLYDRTMHVWPEAIAELMSDGNLIIGGGLGKVGDPGLLTNDKVYLADNIFLNVALSTGVFSVFIWYFFAVVSLRVNRAHPSVGPMLSIYAFLFLNGITAGIVIGVTGLSMLGFCLGFLSSNRRVAPLPLQRPMYHV